MNKIKDRKKVIVIVAIILIVVFSIGFLIIRKKNKANVSNIPLVKVLESGEKYVGTFEDLENWSIYDENKLNGKAGTEIFITENGYEGKGICFSGDIKNDARIHKVIEVQPDSYYKITVMAKFGVYRDLVLSSISSMNSTISYPITNSFTNWKKCEIHIKTDKTQSKLDLSLGLGSYDEKSAGVVYFDNFTIERLGYVPNGKPTIKLIDDNMSKSNILAETSDLEIKIVYVIIAIIIFAIILFL